MYFSFLSLGLRRGNEKCLELSLLLGIKAQLNSDHWHKLPFQSPASSFQCKKEQRGENPVKILTAAPWLTGMLQSDLRVQSAFTVFDFKCLLLTTSRVWWKAGFVGIRCSSPTCSVSSCNLWRRKLSQIWESRQDPEPPDLPLSDPAQLLWLSSQPWHTGPHDCIPEVEKGQSNPPGSYRSNSYATVHLNREQSAKSE